MYSDMALITSAYELRKSIVTVPFSAVTMVLPADPRRWSAYFMVIGAGASATWVDCGSQVLVAPSASGQQLTTSFLAKFTDLPGPVGSQWYCWNSNAGGVHLEIWESIFVG
jgi:hypothetical protein